MFINEEASAINTGISNAGQLSQPDTFLSTLLEESNNMNKTRQDLRLNSPNPTVHHLHVLEAVDATRMIEKLQMHVWLDYYTVFGIIGCLVAQRSIRIHDVGNLATLEGIDKWNPIVPHRLDSRKLLIPFYLLTMNHWILIELDCVQRRFCVLDSIKQMTAGFITAMAKIMQRITIRLEDSMNSADLRLPWTQRDSGLELSQQQGPDDCGIYVVYFALYISIEQELGECNAVMWR